MVTQPCKYTKNQRIVHFKELNCTVYKLYLNKTVIKTTYRQGTEYLIMLTEQSYQP